MIFRTYTFLWFFPNFLKLTFTFKVSCVSSRSNIRHMKYFDFDFDLSHRLDDVSVSVSADFWLSDLNSRGKSRDKTNIVNSRTVVPYLCERRRANFCRQNSGQHAR